MDNFSIRLLNEKGMVACNLQTFGGRSKLFEKVNPLSQKHMPPLKGQLSSPIVYFGDSYHVGEKNFTSSARGGLIHQERSLFTRNNYLCEYYCPRFVLVIFWLVSEETDIPRNK